MKGFLIILRKKLKSKNMRRDNRLKKATDNLVLSVVFYFGYQLIYL